jgi:DNA-binding CsgD family transcriptional regulator
MTMNLSPRQLQVMRLICEGQRDKEIAARLCISIFTVRFHAGRAMRKLGASNIQNAAFLFGIITKEDCQ